MLKFARVRDSEDLTTKVSINDNERDFERWVGVYQEDNKGGVHVSMMED